MKICFMQSSQACGRYRPECRQIVANLENCEVVISPNDADVIVQFFCIQTDQCIQEAAAQLHYIKMMKKEDAKVVIAGCAANVLGDEFLKFPGVDYVVQRKPVAKTILEILGQPNCENKYFLGDEEPTDFSLEISNGCQKKGGACNFCFHQMAKIPVRSKPMEYLLTAVKNATEAGARKVSLMALNTCNYGIDFPEHKPLLHDLIHKISEIEKVRLIDVYSLTVANMYPELVQELSTNPKVGLVEMGIQSGSNRLLEIMNTGSTTEQIEELFQAILPHKRFKTIVIVGHPGETEEDVEKTIQIIQKYNLWYAQVVPYQFIEGTVSGNMQQIPQEVTSKRYEQIKKKQAEMRKEYLDSLIGKKIKAYLSEAGTQEDSSVKVYMDDVLTPISFCYNCSADEFKQKFEDKEEYDVITGIVRRVISDEEMPEVEITDIEG